MTHEELRNLDFEIAEKVMGWIGKPYGNGNGEWSDADGKHVSTWGTMPKFSTDLAAAWAILEKSSGSYEVSRMWKDGDVSNGFEYYAKVRFGDVTVGTFAETVPLAICRAALDAIEGAKK